MRYFISIIFLFIALTTGIKTLAQSEKAATFSDTLPFARILDINPRHSQTVGDTVWEYSGICKILKVSKYVKGNSLSSPISKPRMEVHGNIFYDFLFRSYADTPYYQKDFRQHTIRTSIAITTREKYTFRINTSIRISNSPYFRNFFDGGLQFDRGAYLVKMKQLAERKVAESLMQKSDLKMIEAALAEKIRRYNNLRNSISKPNIAQLLIEARSKRFYEELNPGVSGEKNKVDSSISGVEKFVTEKKQELDSLQAGISVLQKKVDSLKSSFYKEAAELKQNIYKATNAKELKDLMVEKNLSDGKTEKWEKLISDVRSVGIGRSMINYSELTVNNVSLTGVNFEYNPGIYTAFAAGKIDYGFRDFTGRNSSANKQNLLLGRFGIGDKDHKAIILTVFTGKKYNYGSILNDTVNAYINVTGYSIEGLLRKNEDVGLSMEIAKSTRPITGTLNDNKDAPSLFSFADQSNQAISVKGQTIIRSTDTRLSGFLRKSGENFQSFSLFTYNTDQTAWLLKADQSFFKNKVNLVAMLRRNDFTNPFTEKTFKTSTVFTSAQLNVRIPKWPSLGIGYYPGSQLYIIDNDRVRENVYYIMNGSIIHTYSLAGIKMMSSVIYNYYSNESTDSGFVNYSGTNYMISQSLFFRKFQLGANYVSTAQRELKFFTLEANVDYFPVPSFRIGAGGKYNRTESGDVYWGGRAQVMLEIKNLGGLQLQYDKSFLPTINKTLFPVDVGRVSWFKYF
jgi:hypothetical protein